MANISTDQSDFDFWEFVSCAKCQLAFSQDLPFWLTECGHVICNNHLNPDQSCSQCGSQGIQLAPLQREVCDKAVSGIYRNHQRCDRWKFLCPNGSVLSLCRSIQSRLRPSFSKKLWPHKSDISKRGINNFDILSSASSAMWQNLRKLMAFFKAKTTNCECKRIKDMMIRFLLTLSTRMESVRCRRISNFIHSHILFNSLIAPSFDYSNKRPTTNSSPHSIPTPLGPNRLTLAHGQQLPQISSREQHNPGLSRSHAHGQENQSHFSNTLQRRPISSRSLEQYVYVPPDTPKFQVQRLSYPHADPKTFQNTNQLQSDQARPAMPPTTSLFTPALGSKAQFPNKGSVGQAFPQKNNMGPPPTPQRFRAHKSNTADILAKNRPTNHLLPPLGRRQQLQNTDTTIPGTSYQQPSIAASQRFFQITSTSNPRGSSSRPSAAPTTRGEHRMPFIPEGADSRQGFG